MKIVSGTVSQQSCKILTNTMASLCFVLHALYSNSQAHSSGAVSTRFVRWLEKMFH